MIYDLFQVQQDLNFGAQKDASASNRRAQRLSGDEIAALR